MSQSVNNQNIEYKHECLLQAMIAEPLAAVRCVALRSLGQVLEAVDSLPPSDAKIFNE